MTQTLFWPDYLYFAHTLSDDQWAPLHLAADMGDLLVYKHILEKSKNKNPKTKIGEVPLSRAAFKVQHVKIDLNTKLRDTYSRFEN